MIKMKLSKLKKVDLRDVWGHEALDFTHWLSQDENLSLLSDEIGISIKLLQTEASVGKFNVDILAEEENSGRKIIIENQLEETNHDHLGKIITYASGYDANIVIWIVRNYREEHQKAIDWLNEHTDENLGFYLLKLELWQIGESDPAPKFEVVVSPNEWAKVIKTLPEKTELTDTKIKQFEFWTSFKNYVLSKDKHIRLQSPRYQHWYDVTIGSSEAHISLTINSIKNLAACELYINRNKDLFFYLQNLKEQIENDLGENAEWIDSDVASSIKIRKEFEDILNLSISDNVFDWLYQETKLFQKVFTPLLKSFKNNK